MIIINKPEPQTIAVKCYRCGRVMNVSPMTNMHAPFLTDCDMHKLEDVKDKCQHESDDCGKHYMGETPDKCTKCGEFYR